MNTAFWRDKRVFLTGHTGFKGGWMALWLEQMGADVFGYSLAPATEPNFFQAVQLSRGIKGKIADLAARDTLETAMREHKPDIVIHAAAQALVLPSYKDPVATFATNVMGTVHVLDAMRRQDSVRVAINVTSDKCYENKETTRGYREDDPMGGHDPYSASKGAAELVTSAYRNSYFTAANVKLASVRAGNVIGGGDWSEARLVPDIFRAFARGEKVRLRHPKAVRAWQHVLDPVRGYLMLAERLWESDGTQFADGWNFGPAPSEIYDVETVTRLFAKRWGSGAAFEVEGNAASPHEAGLLLLDSTRAKERLDWSPRLSFEQTLEWTTDWYRAFYDGRNDMRAFSHAQIEQFAALGANDAAA